MASVPSAHLSSTQTAIAFIVPQSLQGEINHFRSLHDKSYRKWPSHINLLYPFVPAVQLPAALGVMRQALAQEPAGRTLIQVHRTDCFRHRKNATVVLRLSPESERRLSGLRELLVRALGCRNSDGTVDGTYRPHISLGQASLLGSAVSTLINKAEKLSPVRWETSSLAVLQRQPNGQMEEIGHIDLNPDLQQLCTDFDTGDSARPWQHCYRFVADSGWTAGQPQIKSRKDIRQEAITVHMNSYNLLSEPSAPPFAARLPLAVQAIESTISATEASLRILCLQEIDEKSLPLLLSDEFIQHSYPFSSHLPSTPLSSQRNLVTLSSSPFVQIELQFKEHHKSALIIRFISPDVTVVNVHLTSALTDESVAVKMRQMDSISSFLSTSRECHGSSVLLAGDFNVTTSTRTIETALLRNVISPKSARDLSRIIDPDVWSDAFLEYTRETELSTADDFEDGEAGATFNRANNPLAALSPTPIDRNPQRYDRIIFRKCSTIRVDNFERFGLPNDQNQCASDHYGVSATLRIGQGGKSAVLPPTVKPGDELGIILIDDTMQLEGLIQEQLPGDDDLVRRVAAADQLQQVLTNHERLRGTLLAPLGSFAMGTYFPSSDVDVLAIGKVSPRDFFALARPLLQTLTGSGSESLHFVNSLVPILEITFSGIKFDIQYCQAPELLGQLLGSQDGLDDLSDAISNPAVFECLRPDSLRPLNTYRDTAYMLKTIPNLEVFRTAHRYLSIFLKRHGLYSAKFGYLGGIHLSLMLNRVVKLLDSQYGRSDSVSAASLVRTFFQYYADFDWAAETVIDPVLHAGQPYARTAREAVVIQSLHTPTARPNVAASCTQLTAQALTAEFRNAASRLADGDWEWCLRDKADCSSEFLMRYSAFIRLSLDMWDIDEVGSAKVRDAVGILESKIPLLMVSLGKLEKIKGRVWPARFREAASVGKQGDGTNVRGCYLIGISAQGEQPDIKGKRLMESKVLSAVRSFESSLRDIPALSRDFSYVDIAVFSRKKVLATPLVLDERDWAAIPVSQSLDDGRRLVEDSQCQTRLNDSCSSMQRALSGSKLRPAQDILSRIRWDPGLDVDDYIIGYEDRFVGVKDMPLSQWKADQTDMEFIPMHRIVWIKKRTSNDREIEAEAEIVWDRRERVDKIFGSGRR